MKKYLLSAVLLISGINSYAQETILDTINFDKPTALIRIDTSLKDNIWQIGRPQKTIFDSAYSRPNVIVTDTLGYYPASNISSFILVAQGPTNMSSPYWNACVPPNISFWQKYDMDTLQDSGVITVSSDMGKTWVRPDVYCQSLITSQPNNVFTGTNSKWTWVAIYFNPANACSTTLFPSCDTALFKFTFYSSSTSSSHEGWMIDNINIGYDICEGIDELSANLAQTNVYPNPAGGLVSIQYQLPVGQRGAIFDLYNEMGQLMKVENINTNAGTMEEDISSLSNGVYYYTLSINGTVEATNKLIVIH